MFRFQDGLGFINESAEEVETAQAVSVDGHGPVRGVMQQGLSNSHKFSPINGGSVLPSARVNKEGESIGGRVDPSPHTGDAFNSVEAPISVVSCSRGRDGGMGGGRGVGWEVCRKGKGGRRGPEGGVGKVSESARRVYGWGFQDWGLDAPGGLERGGPSVLEGRIDGEGGQGLLQLGIEGVEEILVLRVASGVDDCDDEVGVGGGLRVGDLATSPQWGGGVEFSAPWYGTCDLHPGVGEVVVSCGVVWG